MSVKAKTMLLLLKKEANNNNSQFMTIIHRCLYLQCKSLNTKNINQFMNSNSNNNKTIPTTHQSWVMAVLDLDFEDSMHFKTD